LRRAVLASKMGAAPLTGRRAGLVAQMAPKKSLANFFENFKLTGARPRNTLTRTQPGTASINAYSFLSKNMLIPVGGSRYPNKLDWKQAVNSLNKYELTNAQKNLIRRVNIAIASQPTKGRFEIRRQVKGKLTGNRNKNIAAHKASMKAENEEKRRNEQAQENRERRGARSAGKSSSSSAKPAWKPPSGYGMF
jgi:hypothetical protein